MSRAANQTSPHALASVRIWQLIRGLFGWCFRGPEPKVGVATVPVAGRDRMMFAAPPPRAGGVAAPLPVREAVPPVPFVAAPMEWRYVSNCKRCFHHNFVVSLTISVSFVLVVVCVCRMWNLNRRRNWCDEVCWFERCPPVCEGFGFRGRRWSQNWSRFFFAPRNGFFAPRNRF